MFGILLIVVLAILLFALYKIYVSVILTRNKVQEAFSAIDVQLKKRYDLIPNILTIAGKFMEHERNIMEEVTRLRSQAVKLGSEYKNIDKKIDLESQITAKMGQIMVAVEQYPQLKSDQTMMTAMRTYNEVEEHIAAARRFYNAAALELKNSVEIFPSSAVAGALGIKAVKFFEIENEAERKSPSATDYLK